VAAEEHIPGSAIGPTPEEVESLVRSLAGLMRTGGITDLDVSFGAVAIRMRGASTPLPVPLPPGTIFPNDAIDGLVEEPQHLIRAPMIGTFYSSPSPGTPPFVAIGDSVTAGQVIGIIEAMKIMNEIIADHGGFVRDLLVENGQAVEYGSPLLRLSLGKAS